MLRPALQVEQMGNRKDLDWAKTVCPMQALAQHRARIQTLLPNRCDVLQAQGRFSSRQEPNMRILRSCMHKFHLVHPWGVLRGAPMASKIYRTWST